MVGVPRRVSLRRGELRGRISTSGVGGNGCLRVPGDGEMRSFWFIGGMCKVEEIRVVRSVRVLVEGRVNSCGVLRWWILRVSGGSEVVVLGSEGSDILAVRGAVVFGGVG